MASEAKTLCWLDIREPTGVTKRLTWYKPCVQTRSMSPMLHTSVPGMGSADTHCPDAFFTCMMVPLPSGLAALMGLYDMWAVQPLISLENASYCTAKRIIPRWLQSISFTQECHSPLCAHAQQTLQGVCRPALARQQATVIS